MHRLLLTLAAFVIGCALQLHQRELFAAWIYMLFSGFAGTHLAWSAIKLIVEKRGLQAPMSRPYRAAKVLMWMVGAVLLGFGQTGWRAAAYQSQALNAELEGRDVRITGIIAQMPQRDESGLRFRMDVESAQLLTEGVRTVALPPRIQLAWYRSLPRLSEDAAAVPFAELTAQGQPRAGERWQLVARLKAPHGNLNPHGFDYELWLWEQGIAATGYVRAGVREAARGDAPVKIGSTWQHPMEAARQSVRDAIFERVSNAQLAGVIAALVVGDQAAIDRADWDVYRATGVAHLMSISGLHITMFAWGAALLIGALWRRSQRLTTAWPAQHAALWGGVLLASLYALFAGWGLPAQRTVWMLLVICLLRSSGKRWPWPLVWLLALAVLTALDPWALLSGGFWLSFVAVGVLFASDAGRRDDLPSNVSWGQRFMRLLREQWVITLALAPLSLLLFNQVSLVGLLANVLAIPWVTLLVTPLALAGVIWAPLWDAAAWGVQLLGIVLSSMAQWPFATISIASSAGLMPAIALFGGILCIMKLPLPWRAMGALMVIPLLLTQPARPASGEFALLAADIGQGNAVLIQTAQHSLLYDAGPRFSRESDAGQRTLVPLLRALGERLDVLVISHRDADHIGGAQAVLKMQLQAKLISSIEAEHELQQLRAAERCTAGQRWQWDGIDFHILHPQASDYTSPQKPNAMSCALRISNGRQTVLLTGDLEAAQEQRLITESAPLKANLLLVPHHGSKTSSTESFIDAVQPQIALVQAGYRNRFQHPVPEVMARYQERNIQIMSSPRCGAARWASDAPQVSCQREAHRRYWHHRLP
ncbi:MAG: DNA internalization-related competence protein ComEC/Rec2 [Brachymonas sp.]